jgi:TolA-binding protein
MRLAMLSLVALALLGVSKAEAQGIRWATSFDEALREAKERGVLILCVLNMSNPPEAANEEMIRLLSSSKAVEKVCRQFVCVWGNKDRHREVRKRVDGKDRSVCPHLGNCPCSVHQEMEKILTRRYGDVVMGKDGYVRMPVQFLIDGDGEVVEMVAAGDADLGFDPVPEGDFVARLAAAAKKYGPGLTSDEYHRLRKLVEEADALKEKGEYAAAAAKYREVQKATTKKVASVEKADAALAEITEIGQKGLAEADALVKEGKYGEALDRLREVARAFRNSDAGDRAEARLKELRKNPEVARMLREAADQEASETLLAAGRAAEKAENWKKALDAYRSCSERYPETEAGKAAKARLDELMADPEIGAAIREAAAAKDCRSWLNLARNFIGNNLPDRARVYLRKVIDTYPGTSYAKKAQEMLDGLK